MGKSSAPAPMPDYAGILAAQAAARQSEQQAAIAQQQLDWAKQTYGTQQQQIQPILDRTVRGMDQQYQYAADQKNFYDTTYRPIESDFADTAMTWDSPERRERMAGEAAADVAQQYEGARLAAAQQLKDFGIDPTSGRYASNDLAMRVTEASTAAGAQNMARRAVEQQGLALKQAAINVGRGYPNAINQTWQNAGASGSGAIGNINNSGLVGSQMMGSPTQWAGLSNQAQGTWGNIANNNYQNYLQGYQFQNTPQSSGLGSALGLIGGSLIQRFDEGGSVPPGASPSYGAQVDDIPARLNAGEFIMPREAVSWFGEKTMHDMILKAQKERVQVEQQSGAVPDVMPARPEAPRLISGPKPVAALPAR